MTSGGKMKIPNTYCTSARHAKSHSKASIVCSWKCRCSSSDKLYRKRKCHVLTLIWPLGMKWKFWNLNGHLKDIFSHILEYHLSILSNVIEFQWQQLNQKRHFWFSVDPWGKNENFKTLLRICKICSIRS